MADSSPILQRFEFSFIDWIRERSATRPEVLLGIGDDAARIAPQPNQEWLATVDVLSDGVHFTLETATPEQIGRKAVAVNLSDIAAMAGEPVAAFVGIVLPRTCGRTFAEKLYQGILTTCSEWNVCLAGGDTNVGDGPLVISVTLLGQAHPKGSVLRTGAEVGDWIFTTGALGGSLQSGRHLDFTPRVREAWQLHETSNLHAMLDISDGLAGDLHHLLQNGELGARISAERIPIHPDVDEELPFIERLQHACEDGEDFELLFTVAPEEGRRLLNDSSLGIPLSWIGEITETSDVVLQGPFGAERIEPRGWIHSCMGDASGNESSK